MMASYLTLLDKHLDRIAQADEMKGEDSTRELQTFRNVVLRYDDTKEWKKYLDWLRQRKGWWDSENDEWTSNFPKWIRLFWEWVNDLKRVNECLDEADKLLRQIHFEDGGFKKRAPISKSDWDNLLKPSLEKLRKPVLREFLLRAMEGALYV